VLVLTEDPEHEADLDMGEEDVSRTKRVLQRVVDVFCQSADVGVIAVVVRAIEQSRCRRDDVTSSYDDVTSASSLSSSDDCLMT